MQDREIYRTLPGLVLFNVPFILYPHSIKNTKEETTMKTAVVKRTDFNNMPVIPYPNAATREEMLHKILDLLLVAAIGAGLAACLIFLIALS